MAGLSSNRFAGNASRSHWTWIAPALSVLMMLTGAACAQAGAILKTPQLTVDPASIAFGQISIGGSGQQTITMSNPSNRKITVSSATVSGAGYSISGLMLPITLSPRQRVSFAVMFTPGTAGAVNGSVLLMSTALNSPAAISLSGSGTETLTGPLNASPTSLNLGDVTLGTSATNSVVLSNSGSSSVTISQVSIAGSGFRWSGITLPFTLAAGQSTALNITFAPDVTGSATGSVTVSSNSFNSPASVAVSGTGSTPTAELAINPGSVSFGDVLLGNSRSQLVTLTNSSGTSITVSSAGVSGAGFSMSGLQLPLALAAGQSTSFSVSFAPPAAGSAAGSVSVASNATNSPHVISLSGFGVSASSGQASLTWDPSPSAVAGYYVYRSTQAGGPYTRLTAALLSVTTYADATVVSGQRYCYVVTAVDSSGAESAYSNELVFTAP